MRFVRQKQSHVLVTCQICTDVGHTWYSSFFTDQSSLKKSTNIKKAGCNIMLIPTVNTDLTYGMFTLSNTENDICSKTEKMTKSCQWQGLRCSVKYFAYYRGTHNYHCQPRLVSFSVSSSVNRPLTSCETHSFFSMFLDFFKGEFGINDRSVKSLEYQVCME